MKVFAIRLDPEDHTCLDSLQEALESNFKHQLATARDFGERRQGCVTVETEEVFFGNQDWDIESGCAPDLFVSWGEAHN